MNDATNEKWSPLQPKDIAEEPLQPIDFPEVIVTELELTRNAAAASSSSLQVVKKGQSPFDVGIAADLVVVDRLAYTVAIEVVLGMAWVVAESERKDRSVFWVDVDTEKDFRMGSVA
ncbi:hypothetical protein HDU98_003184 [Podochytrium sp. JEL0797]|nr:hypothetical protein HDU98_003184 [Podochytrium sp. JEL0797]